MLRSTVAAAIIAATASPLAADLLEAPCSVLLLNHGAPEHLTQSTRDYLDGVLDSALIGVPGKEQIEVMSHYYDLCAANFEATIEELLPKARAMYEAEKN